MKLSAPVKVIATTLLTLLVLAGRGAESQPSKEERELDVFHRDYANNISKLTSRLESFIANELVKKKGLCEYPPARRYVLRDLDRDKENDLFLITTFELPGGNHYESHFFALLSSNPDTVQHFVIGALGWRDADRFEESDGTLLLQFRVWAKKDAQCCPSLKTTEEVTIEKGRVVFKAFDEIKRRPPGS